MHVSGHFLRNEGLTAEANAVDMDMRYAVLLEPDDGAFQVIVPAFPEIHTFGETVEEALVMARDAIELSIAVRRDEGTEIPVPDADEARLEAVAVNPHAA